MPQNYICVLAASWCIISGEEKGGEKSYEENRLRQRQIPAAAVREHTRAHRGASAASSISSSAASSSTTTTPRRVLPGFQPDSKVRMLLEMKDEAEIVIVISADDMERSKRRGDLGITYDEDALRLIDAFRAIGLYVGSVSITHYRGQAAADVFRKRLEAMNVRVYMQHWIPNYPVQPLADSLRRRLRQERLHRDFAPARRGHRPRPGQRQNGLLPLPALPRAQARREGGLREVRDLPHLEPPAQAPGQPGLRGRHRRPRRRQHDRPLPPGGLRQERGQL